MNRLDSWKEIADYLGVTVRTAQKWEQARGLPVRRLPGPRGPVSADVDELEAWRRASGTKAAHGADETDTNAVLINADSVTRRSGLARAMLALSLAGVFVVIAAVTYAAIRKPANPVSVFLEKDVMVAVAADGRVLWRRTFPDLNPGFYTGMRRWSWVGDLDGDGRNELLFSYGRIASDQGSGDILLALNGDGTERWRFVPGRDVRTATERFDPPFEIDSFEVFPVEGRLRIAISAHHATYYPAQLALLSPDGKLVSEYWHSGHLQFLKVADFQHDGHYKILLTGVDNGLHAATYIVLDPAQVYGASLEPDPAYQIQGMPPAREQVRLLFPRGCLKDVYPPYNVPSALRLTLTTVSVGIRENVPDSSSIVNYDLTPSGEVLRVVPVDSFFEVHHRLAVAGRLDHEWSPSELDQLRHVRDLAATRTALGRPLLPAVHRSSH